MKSKELDSLINRGRIPPLLFLYTEETFVINEKVEMITNAVLKPGERDLGLVRLEADKLDWPALSNLIDTPPFGAAKKLILVSNLHKMNRIPLEQLISYAASAGIPEFTILVFYGEKMPTNMPRKKKKQQYRTEVTSVKLWKPFEDAIPRIISRRASELGIKLTIPVAEEMLARVGSNLARLYRELEKLAVYIHPRTTVSAEDVRTAATAAARENIFALIDHVIQGDAPESLKSLSDVLDSGDKPIMVFRMLAKRIRLLIQAGGIIDQLPQESKEYLELATAFMKIASLTGWKYNQEKTKLRQNAQKLMKTMREMMGKTLPQDKKVNVLKQNVRITLSCFYHASRVNEQYLAWALTETARAEFRSRDTLISATVYLEQLVLKLVNGRHHRGYSEEAAL